MDRRKAVERLPETYASALSLRARGLDDAAIAKALLLEPDAVAALIRIAEKKLAAQLDGREPEDRTQSREVDR